MNKESIFSSSLLNTAVKIQTANRALSPLLSACLRYHVSISSPGQNLLLPDAFAVPTVAELSLRKKHVWHGGNSSTQRFSISPPHPKENSWGKPTQAVILWTQSSVGLLGNHIRQVKPSGRTGCGTSLLLLYLHESWKVPDLYTEI